jgi:hypothetical protein
MSDSVGAMLFSRDPEADTALLRDVFGLACTPAGGGWLLVALPPGQSGLDPSGEDDAHQLYLTCRDLDQAIAALAARGRDARDTGDGVRAVSVALPGGARIRLDAA